MTYCTYISKTLKNDLNLRVFNVIYEIMKYFIFRKDQNGFQDWIKSIKLFRWVIRTHQAGAKNDEEYREAYLWYVNYLAFMKELNPAQKEFIKIKENGHIPPYSLVTGFDINFIYEKWLEIVANSKLNQLAEITNEEVGKVIAQARKHLCLSRAQVAGVIGISADTLKAYENGKRTLPFDLFYKLIQFIYLNIGIIRVDD